ncbi:sulfite exporter TauE/SafE family protein [Halomonas elongata]|uniref:sulfite exporter TauE/SafE family protein n=1 Tax=Halomonas elongata TaxID=2746 RepID=UPI0023B08570|nr:sulfite exporter TauE/SafE family protein [Halomonas elongata]
MPLHAFVASEGWLWIFQIAGRHGTAQYRPMTDLLALPTLITITLVFLLAGTVKGIVGLGLPSVVIGLLGLIMLPAEAAALMVLPSLLTNLWQSATGPSLTRLSQRLWPFLAAIVVGVLGIGALLPGHDHGWATNLLGIALFAYALFGLSASSWRIGEQAEGWLGGLAGILTGGITAITGIAVMPTAPYLQAIGLTRDDLVQALGLTFTISTLALGGILLGGPLTASTATVSLVALLPAMLGMRLGKWLRQRIEARRFRGLFFMSLMLLGLHLALRGLG